MVLVIVVERTRQLLPVLISQPELLLALAEAVSSLGVSVVQLVLKSAQVIEAVWVLVAGRLVAHIAARSDEQGFLRVVLEQHVTLPRLSCLPSERTVPMVGASAIDWDGVSAASCVDLIVRVRVAQVSTACGHVLDLFLFHWRGNDICLRLLLVVLLHEPFDHSEVGVRIGVFGHLAALTAVLPVHQDYQQDKARVEEDEDDELELDHTVALMVVVSIWVCADLWTAHQDLQRMDRWCPCVASSIIEALIFHQANQEL